MIEVKFGRYVPTLETTDFYIARNIFRSEIHEVLTTDLTTALNKSKEWLDDHFGFVLLYSNGTQIKRSCNYKLFEKTLKQLNILIYLENHIN